MIKEKRAMVDLTFDEILEAAVKLPPHQKQQLAAAIQPRSLRDEILAETERLHRVGAFENAESLFGKYAGSHAGGLDDYLTQIGREWEDELDEFFGDDH